LWTKIFKALKIYDQDYHEKYRRYIFEKRYEVYIDKIIEDILNKIMAKNKKQIEEIMKENFPEPKFVCPDFETLHRSQSGQ